MEQNVFQIVFSASPQSLADAGWELSGNNIRLLAPASSMPSVPV
jgi:hypothetical protein